MVARSRSGSYLPLYRARKTPPRPDLRIPAGRAPAPTTPHPCHSYPRTIKHDPCQRRRRGSFLGRNGAARNDPEIFLGTDRARLLSWHRCCYNKCVVTLTLKTDFRDVGRVLNAVSGRDRDRAAAMALNATAAKARTTATRTIAAKYTIKQTDVRSRVRVLHASASRLIAAIEAEPARRGRRSVNVIAFAPREDPRGVTVMIRRGMPRNLIRGAFIANQGRTVFTRIPDTTMASRSSSKGRRHREQIRGVSTIDLGQMFNSRRINDAVMTRIRSELSTEAERAVRRVLSRI